MNIVRFNSSLTVAFSDGTVLTSSSCTDELFNDVVAHQNDENYVKSLLSPKIKEVVEKVESVKDILIRVKKSKILSLVGSSIYIKSICELSVPQDLVEAILDAEESKNTDLVQSYLNFWTLASQNPDSRARMNLFWFLSKYGLTVTKSGFFVAYRKVLVKSEGKVVDNTLTKFITDSYFAIKAKKKGPKSFTIIKSTTDLGLYVVKSEKAVNLEPTETILGNVEELYKGLSSNPESEKSSVTIYTDAHTKTFEIKIGEIVTMDRDKCDAVQENTCSRGLHVASREWIRSHGSGFGNTNLVCLINPSDVVAVPPQDSYGKMRVSAYYPVKVADADFNDTIPDGFEDDFITKVISFSKINNDEAKTYNFAVSEIPEVNKTTILQRLDDIKNMKKVIL